MKTYVTHKKTTKEKEVTHLTCDFCGTRAKKEEKKVHELSLWRTDDIAKTIDLEMCVPCFKDIVVGRLKNPGLILRTAAKCY